MESPRVPNIKYKPSYATTVCHFLDRLPPELRLAVYEYLVVTKEPLKGIPARNDHDYGLNLDILRTNRQIHEEAKSLFYGKNTFYITSIPATETAKPDPKDTAPSENQAGFEPPLHPSIWSLLRHLTADLIYLPLTVPKSPPVHTWRPIDAGAQAYITALTSLLQSTGPKLLAFSLSADIQPTYDIKKSLTSFFLCDRDRGFARALAGLAVERVDVGFEFQDCYWRERVGVDLFLGRSILLLACQVFFCQSQVRIDNLLKRFEREGQGGVERDADGERAKEVKEVRTDLGPRVGKTWPGRAEDLHRKVAEELREQVD
jgi:hypothetical protein